MGSCLREKKNGKGRLGRKKFRLVFFRIMMRVLVMILGNVGVVIRM